MNIDKVCSRYFAGFDELSRARYNTAGKNTVAVLKVISYMTIVIPLAFALSRWVFTKKKPTPQDAQVTQVAAREGVIKRTDPKVVAGNLEAAIERYNEIVGMDEGIRNRFQLVVYSTDEMGEHKFSFSPREKEKLGIANIEAYISDDETVTAPVIANKHGSFPLARVERFELQYYAHPSEFSELLARGLLLVPNTKYGDDDEYMVVPDGVPLGARSFTRGDVGLDFKEQTDS